jgi:hypothetical protein
MGNPPFVGYSYQSKKQKEDLHEICAECGNNIDYVAGWYYKAAQIMQNTNIQTAFVSTNSITQGEQVYAVWKSLIEKYQMQINFAYRTFRWDSEASLKAHVHCVIIGFGCHNPYQQKIIYDGNKQIIANHINPYLVNASDVFIEKRKSPICYTPEMIKGSQPTDGGNLILSEAEKLQLIKIHPEISKYIRPFVGADEFINHRTRYCLWLKDASPNFIKNNKVIRERIEKVRDMRLSSTKASTRSWADKPYLFTEDRHCENCSYIIVPSVSSEQRKYIPIGFLSSETIASNLVLIIPNATLYHFGVLTSNVHMACMRAVCGRLEMRYRYSNTIVYNNFPWPMPNDDQKAKIEASAQAILDARALYPDSSLADLYDEVTMPAQLRKAHQNNDRAVMEAYGFDWRHMSESECVAELFKLYQKLVKQEAAKTVLEKPRRTRKKSES